MSLFVLRIRGWWNRICETTSHFQAYLASLIAKMFFLFIMTASATAISLLAWPDLSLESLMSSPWDARDREILQHLHRSAGADIQTLCDVLGVTRTAVRQRIFRLESAGMIASELQGQSRGRPRLVYHVTAGGLHELGENYRELAVVLWEAISGFENTEIRQRLIVRVRNSLAERFRRQLVGSESVDDRLDQLAEEMKSSGFNVESDHSGGLRILRETSCPFPMLADVDEAICQVELEVLQQVLGAPVEFRSRCRDGHSCCEFQVMEQPASDSGCFSAAVLAGQTSESCRGD